MIDRASFIQWVVIGNLLKQWLFNEYRISTHELPNDSITNSEFSVSFTTCAVCIDRIACRTKHLIALVSSYYLRFRLDLMTLYYTYFILCTSCGRLSRLPTYAFPHAHLDTFSITSLSKSPAPCFSLVFWYICHCIFTIHFQLHLAISAVASCYIFCCISSGIPCHLSATYQITYPATSPVTVLIHCYICGHHITSYDLCTFTGFKHPSKVHATPPHWCN